MGMLILFLSVWGNGCAAHSLVINVNHGLEVGKLVNRYALENRYWRNQCGTDIEWKFETRESSGRLPQFVAACLFPGICIQVDGIATQTSP